MRCGTVHFAENLKNPQKRMLAKSGCYPESLYGDVVSRTTQNFIIYYTRTGSHAIKENRYIDTLAFYLEQAYNLHKNILGMKNMLGARKTFHYLQDVPNGLYPVEVVDTGLLRDLEGEYSLAFGLTFSPGTNLKATQIVLENDFLSGADCSGNLSTKPFLSYSGINYSINWNLGLKITVFHELYHAFQFTYYDISKNSTFWLESSAAAVEAIGAPDVDDYVGYLQYNFKSPGTPMSDIKSGSYEEYSWASLYLFLYSRIGPRFDSEIWNWFSKYPKNNFEAQLDSFVNSLQKKHRFDKNTEDLFHEYATHVFYSGNRADFSPYAHFWMDMQKWPEWKINTETPVLAPGAIDFVRTANGEEPSTVSARKTLLHYGNSSVWALSRLLEKEIVATKTIVAYPNPWNPRKNPALSFKHLPEKSKGVEIRTANGALLTRLESKQGDSLLIWEPKKFPAPGILYYRTLPHGKNKTIIIQY